MTDLILCRSYTGRGGAHKVPLLAERLGQLMAAKGKLFSAADEMRTVQSSLIREQTTDE